MWMGHASWCVGWAGALQVHVSWHGFNAYLGLYSVSPCWPHLLSAPLPSCFLYYTFSKGHQTIHSAPHI